MITMKLVIKMTIMTMKVVEMTMTMMVCRPILIINKDDTCDMTTALAWPPLDSMSVECGCHPPSLKLKRKINEDLFKKIKLPHISSRHDWLPEL